MKSAGELTDIIDFLHRYHKFAIVGHMNPDSDCLSSQLAIESFARRLGKEARCYSPGPFLRPEIQSVESRFSSGPLETPEAVIVVDCSTPERIGRYADEIGTIPTAVIDHHASGVPFGTVHLIEPSAPSVTYMILKLIEAYGKNPTKEEAELLFFGLCTDTGFFRHLEAGSREVFFAAGRLVAAGASPKDTFARMFGNRSFQSRKLLSRLLERAEQRYGGKLLVTWETEADLREFNGGERDSDALYQELQVVRGCSVVVLVKQETETGCSVGLRSTGNVDVGVVARHFGGGGHRGASGYSCSGFAADVAREIVEYFRSILA